MPFEKVCLDSINLFKIKKPFILIFGREVLCSYVKYDPNERTEQLSAASSSIAPFIIGWSSDSTHR